MHRRVRWALAGAALVTACGGGGSTADIGDEGQATLPLAESITTDVTQNTGAAEELAPSQLIADTVPPPATPGPCSVGDLDFWTAQVMKGAETADAVIRVRNVGDVWCESDISGSERVDRAIEPNVWLDPGGWADLVVGQSEDECDEPTAVRSAQVDVNGTEVVVPTAAVLCGWRLTAFFPNEIAAVACDPADLDTAVVDDVVLVRNPSFVPCELGELATTDGFDVAQRRDDTTTPAVRELAGGDVVAFGQLLEIDTVCAGDVISGVFTFERAGAVVVEGLSSAARYELGAGRPWYGAPDGPLAAFPTGRLDVGAALAALDPFDSGDVDP